MKDSKKQDDFYRESYSILMGTGLVAKVWKFVHQTMEKPFRNKVEGMVLELGAGNGEHYKSVASSVKSYYATDIRDDILRNSLGGQPNVYIEMQDVHKLSYPNHHFDRVIMTCVLAHLDDPLLALKEIRRVIKPGGHFSLYLPCEPGILLRAIRPFGIPAKGRRLGIKDIALLHFLEHRNYFLSMNYFVKSVFSDDKIRGRYYPFPFLSWNFNLFRLYNIKIN